MWKFADRKLEFADRMMIFADRPEKFADRFLVLFLFLFLVPKSEGIKPIICELQKDSR